MINAMQHLIHEVTSSVIVEMLEIYLFLALMGETLNSHVKDVNYCLTFSSTAMLNVGNYSVIMEQQTPVYTSKSCHKLSTGIWFCTVISFF